MAKKRRVPLIPAEKQAELNDLKEREKKLGNWGCLLIPLEFAVPIAIIVYLDEVVKIDRSDPARMWIPIGVMAALALALVVTGFLGENARNRFRRVQAEAFDMAGALSTLLEAAEYDPVLSANTGDSSFAFRLGASVEGACRVKGLYRGRAVEASTCLARIDVTGPDETASTAAIALFDGEICVREAERPFPGKLLLVRKNLGRKTRLTRSGADSIVKGCGLQDCLLTGATGVSGQWDAYSDSLAAALDWLAPGGLPAGALNGSRRLDFAFFREGRIVFGGGFSPDMSGDDPETLRANLYASVRDLLAQGVDVVDRGQGHA